MLTNQIRVRVEWGDCDPARIVFYPRYFSWVDASGHHMLEKAGLHHDVLAEKYGVRGLVLGHVEMDFRTTAVFGDTLDIESCISRVGNSSFGITHTVTRDRTIVLTGQETRIWAVEDHESAVGISAKKIPDEVRLLFENSPG